ncbi:methyltransferase family protein [Phyllobacterium myrsinacearum]|uniref:class I SAM-dependent methyltransferase n=1 Tax=Phyllobacterium myrsinacearum TaxID=28101 RepID=UPI00102886A5|nr:class I SAM-dependent methyltransferase [Phyllobacterium myrsinacearum]RZS76786.1 methyltransferase family protein [Phyllobacterium myrsinacearum]
MSYLSLRQITSHIAYASPLIVRTMQALKRRREPPPASEAADWDNGFSDGTWDRLGDLDELAHHAVITGYVARLNPDGHVLDIGCGAGVSEKLLRRWCIGYHGVDLSAVAVAKARLEASSHARFSVADANHFVPDKAYDVIVMCEVSEYFADLENQMRRYAEHLTSGGHLIVSMWASPYNYARWLRIDQTLKVKDQTLLWNAQQTGWMVKVYAR